MTAPRPARLHIWDGRTVPAWLRLDQHHFDAGDLVVDTPDGPARPRSGWSLVGWSDGSVTVASPTTVARVYGPDGVYARLARAEADVQRVAVLYEQWVKAGAPPLGVSLARWWDRRLIELHDAIHAAPDTRETP